LTHPITLTMAAPAPHSWAAACCWPMSSFPFPPASS
jgi:hypothetical protein